MKIEKLTYKEDGKYWREHLMDKINEIIEYTNTAFQPTTDDDIESGEKCSCGQLRSKHGNGASGYCTPKQEIRGSIGSQSDWQEEFDKNFGNFQIWNKFNENNFSNKELKSFISNLLSTQKEGFVRKLEGKIITEEPSRGMAGYYENVIRIDDYNKALSDAIQIIKG